MQCLLVELLVMVVETNSYVMFAFQNALYSDQEMMPLCTKSCSNSDVTRCAQAMTGGWVQSLQGGCNARPEVRTLSGVLRWSTPDLEARPWAPGLGWAGPPLAMSLGS